MSLSNRLWQATKQCAYPLLSRSPRARNELERGFTLIELMIVIAIVAILTMILVPQLQDFVRKTRFSEMLTTAAQPKSDIEAYYQVNGSLPSNSISQSYSKASVGGEVANSMTVATSANGNTITIDVKSHDGSASTLHPNIKGKTLRLTATAPTAGESLKWSCGSDAAQVYLPPDCTTGLTVTSP